MLPDSFVGWVDEFGVTVVVVAAGAVVVVVTGVCEDFDVVLHLIGHHRNHLE